MADGFIRDYLFQGIPRANDRFDDDLLSSTSNTGIYDPLLFAEFTGDALFQKAWMVLGDSSLFIADWFTHLSAALCTKRRRYAFSDYGPCGLEE